MQSQRMVTADACSRSSTTVFKVRFERYPVRSRVHAIGEKKYFDVPELASIPLLTCST